MNILTGLIRNIFPEESYGNSERKFRKTVLWLTEIGVQYPSTWEIEFWNDDGGWLKSYTVGNKVNVNVAIVGRLSSKNGEERVFNTIRGVKIQKIKQ